MSNKSLTKEEKQELYAKLEQKAFDGTKVLAGDNMMTIMAKSLKRSNASSLLAIHCRMAEAGLFED
jgi:hypothetical protein